MTPRERDSVGSCGGDLVDEPHHRKPSRMSIKEFDILKCVSRGAYGRVFLARKKTTGDVYAIKVLRKSEMVRRKQVKRVMAERDVLANTSSPFLVRFFYSFHGKVCDVLIPSS